jgi:tRNA pseudouridine38-40 synthase
VEAVEAGAKRLVGTHDFATFAGGGEGVPWAARADRQRRTTRTVMRCEARASSIRSGPGIDRPATGLEIRVAADGFLPRMVRNIVGALVEVGQGRQDAEWIGEILAARDRRAGSVVAPPEGLTLWKVGYGADRLDDW